MTKEPSEYRISATWDYCLENSLLNISSGVLVGGIASVVLFRGTVARSLLAGFAGGFGGGVSWMDCKAALKDGVPHQPRLLLPKLSSFPSFPSTSSSRIESKPDQVYEENPQELITDNTN